MAFHRIEFEARGPRARVFVCLYVKYLDTNIEIGAVETLMKPGVDLTAFNTFLSVGEFIQTYQTPVEDPWFGDYGSLEKLDIVVDLLAADGVSDLGTLIEGVAIDVQDYTSSGYAVDCAAVTGPAVPTEGAMDVPDSPGGGE